MVSAEAAVVLPVAGELAEAGEEKRENMITLFTRANCPLCDEAKMMLKLVQEDFPLDWTEVDIESDEALHEKYMLMIPVVERNRVPVIYGKVGYIELLEALEL